MNILDGRGKVEVSAIGVVILDIQTFSSIGVVMLDIQTQSPPIYLSLQASKPVFILLEAG